MEIRRVIIELKIGATAVITPDSDGSAVLDTYLTMMYALDNAEVISSETDPSFTNCITKAVQAYL